MFWRKKVVMPLLPEEHIPSIAEAKRESEMNQLRRQVDRLTRRLSKIESPHLIRTINDEVFSVERSYDHGRLFEMYSLGTSMSVPMNFDRENLVKLRDKIDQVLESEKAESPEV